MGARQMAESGGGVAHQGRDATAAWSNPAGLSRLTRPTATFGLSAGVYDLTPTERVWWDTNRDGGLDDRDTPLQMPVPDPTTGVAMSLGMNLGDRIGIGMSAYVPVAHAVRARTHDPSLPTYFRYDNRQQRFAATAGMGTTLFRGARVGLAVDIAARIRGSGHVSADIRVSGDTDGAEEATDLMDAATLDLHSIDLVVVPNLVPIVGLQLDFGEWSEALHGLQMGARYRAASGFPVAADVDAQANVVIEDVGSLDPIQFASVMKSGLVVYDHFIPSMMQFGVTLDRPWIRLYADARWTGWSKMVMSVARLTGIEVDAPLADLSDVLRDGNDYTIELQNTWSPRVGATLTVPRLKLRSGLEYLEVSITGSGAYDPTPLVSQGASSSFLDGDRVTLSGGLGLEFADPLGLFDGPMRLDTAVQVNQILPDRLVRTADEPTPGFPVKSDALTIGGRIWMVSAQLGFAY